MTPKVLTPLRTPTAPVPDLSVSALRDAVDRIPGDNVWVRRLTVMRPCNIVELGTGQGVSGVQILQAMPADAVFTTVDFYYPENGRHGEFLELHRDDPRLNVVNTDTRWPESLVFVPDGVDLMFLDTTHRAWHAAIEIRLWQRKLIDGAIVIVDDLGMHDMWQFWQTLPYDKWPTEPLAVQGMFRYDRGRPYDAEFPTGKTSKEGQEC